MNTATITVTWSEESGEGHLVAVCQENPTFSSSVVPWSEPITAKSDSWEIANAVTEINGAEIIAVDHDGEYVHVTVNNDMESK